MGDTGTREALTIPLEPAAPAPSAGRWCPDPLGSWPLRWWSGTAWTMWVSDGTSTEASPLTGRRHLDTSDVAHLEFIEEVFLPELATRGVLDRVQADRAQEVVSELADETMQPPPHRAVAHPRAEPVRTQASPGLATPRARPEATGPRPDSLTWSPSLGIGSPALSGDRPAAVPAPEAVSSASERRIGQPAPRRVTPASSPPPGAAPSPAVAPARAAAGTESVSPVREPAPRTPGPITIWMERTWKAVRSDLAVHGLAYLGVLLFFVGAFGLVAFAFGDVQRELRPVAEIVIAAVPFLAAALLLRRGAVIVGRALEVAGGLLLPVMIVTSFLDGVGFPPDLTGPTLVVALTSACLGLTAGYALWVRHHPQSALRYLVVPMLWFTVAMASLGLGRAVPSGEAVAVPGSAQLAATILTLATTVLWARRTPQAPLAQPTCVAAVPGLFVLGLLAVLTWVREGDESALAIGGAGLGALIALELLAAPEPPSDRLSQTWVAVIEPMWWGVTVVALVAPLGAAWACAVGALGYLAMLEFAGRATRPAWALAVPGLGALVLTAFTLDQPWITVGLLSLMSIWALLRGRAPFDVPGAQLGLDVASSLLPVGAVMALADAWAVGPALLTASVTALIAAVATRRWRDDHLTLTWHVWMALAVIAAAAWSVSQLWLVTDTDTSEQWMGVAAVVLLAGAAYLGPLPRRTIPWATLALGSWAWVLACEFAGLPEGLRGLVLAVVGLALVVAAHAEPESEDPHEGASLGAAGHTLGVAAALLAGSGWGFVGSLALFTAAWAVTAISDAHERSPVGRFLAREGASYLAPALMTLGLPSTALAAMHAASPGAEPPWAPLVMSALAVTMAASVRLGLPRRIAQAFAWVAFALPLVTLISFTGPTRAIPALVGVVAAVALLPGDRRWRGMVWVAWAALAPLVGLVAAEASTSFAAEAAGWQAALALCAVGSMQLLGAAAVDRRSSPPAPRWRPKDPALTPVACLGAAEVTLGLTLALPWVTDASKAWVLLAVAVALLATALLAQAGLLGGVAVVLAWVATLVLINPDPLPPLMGVAISAGLLGIAIVAHPRSPGRPWWSRWDVPMALAATPIAASAALGAIGTVDEPLTSFLVGSLVLASALRLRRIQWLAGVLSVTGILLVFNGAHTAGPWWFAAALVALAAGLTASAVRADGPARLALQVSGVLTAVLAWSAIVLAAEWSPAAAADISAVVAGAISLGWAIAARTARAGRWWVLLWGATTAAIVVVVTAASWARADELEPSAALVLGLGLVTGALLVSAKPLELDWLRTAGSLGILATLLTSMEVIDASATQQILTFVALSAACGIATMLTTTDTRRTTIEVGVLSAAGAVGLALQPDNAPSLLVAALAVSSLQAAAVGSTLQNLAIQALSPVLACAAWLVFAADTITGGNAQWWTTSVGLALLVIVGLWRRDRMRLGQPAASPAIVAVELLGEGLLVGAWLALMVTESPSYVLPALVLGSGIAAWGVITKVRRRVMSGAVVVLTATVLLVAVPLLNLLPEWRGAGLWVLIACVGIAAMLVAGLMEQGRSAANAAIGRFSEGTRDWE